MTTVRPLGSHRTQEFHHRVEGTWGEFSTSSGRVAYVMTNARLGAGGTDLERRLTSQLRPVREVLNAADMDFDQLLQRDLDDHRVAIELVPYLLEYRQVGPAFFPPILAVLLPLDDTGTPGAFPQATEVDSVEYEGMYFREERHGDAFQVRRFIDEATNELNIIRFGMLSWNQERAKVVVLDGQHRAMALLAIDRTLRRTWDQSGTGARYQHFYEKRIHDVLAGRAADGIGEIQVPVTVCWFPDFVGAGRNPNLAARSLFVDVNREARPPSADRVALLSDDRLSNILTRALLNQLKGSESDPPLYSVEYDNPSARKGPPTRWSAITSLQTLHQMVERLVFGPKKYITRVDAAIRGRLPSADQLDIFMRSQLRIVDIFERTIDDGEGAFQREELGESKFPRSAVRPLEQEFLSSWGAGILDLLGTVAPYAAHYEALRSLSESWRPGDPGTVDALAREAVFEGVGMYWTLLKSFRHWQEQLRLRAVDRVPEVTEAWNLLREKRSEFHKLRAQNLVGADDAETVLNSDGAYDVYSTQACQIGLALLLATLCEKASVKSVGVARLASALSEALNDALALSSLGGEQLVLVMSQRVPLPLNRIADMNTARAVEFRYLWLELLCISRKGRLLAEVSPQLTENLFNTLRDRARQRYLEQLITEKINEDHRLNRDRSKESLRRTAISVRQSQLEDALEHWFNISRADFRRWVANQPSLPDVDDDDDAGFDGEGDGDGGTDILPETDT